MGAWICIARKILHCDNLQVKGRDINFVSVLVIHPSPPREHLAPPLLARRGPGGEDPPTNDNNRRGIRITSYRQCRIQYT